MTLEAVHARGQDVVLIDDVLTSGATAREAVRALSSAGAARVFVLTLARARSELLVQTLETEAGERAEPRAHEDLDDLFGSWVHDKAVDRALAEQRKVDPKDWA